MPTPLVRETHISTLLFTRDRVYKLLRPVDTGFLDHRSVEARVDAARREYELNRRVCPDVYLGLADVVEDGELADRMIVMKRLPENRSLSAIIGRGELTHDHLREIARTIARLHANAEPVVTADGPGTETQQRRNWEDSFEEMEDFVGPVLDPATDRRIMRLVRAYLDGRKDLFARRVADGYIRDGHGDLLADDIFCLDDGPRILDCLAFRDDLRIGDVLSDVAFLAMDLHRLVGPKAAREFMAFYGEFSGEHHPGSLAHHYVAYRAHVRCKVSCLYWQQGAQEHAAVARMYHRMTLDQLERARTRLVLVGGGPGTGKTSIATRLGDRFGWPVLSSDEVRKDLARVERGEHMLAKPDTGIYEPAMTEATYDELLREARLLLANGQSAVIDASWTDDDQRAKARSLASELLAELIEIECVVAPAIARERVVRRLADGWSTSDATPDIVDHLQTLHDPWPEAMRLDTTKPVAETFERAIELVDGHDEEDGDPTYAPPAIDFWGNYLDYTSRRDFQPFSPVSRSR